MDPNPWAWLESKEAAEEMALQVSFLSLCGSHTVAGISSFMDQVAHWKQYGADGIDLDLEAGAGDQPVRFSLSFKLFFLLNRRLV